MSQPAPSPAEGPPPEDRGPVPTPSEMDDLQQSIRRTREDLGQTVAALVSKTQVKARARDRAAEVADRAGHWAPVARVREYDPVGRVRSYDPVGRISRADVAGRIRGMDLAGRARRHPAPTAVLVAAATGLAATAVVVRRRGGSTGDRRKQHRGRR